MQQRLRVTLNCGPMGGMLWCCGNYEERLSTFIIDLSQDNGLFRMWAVMLHITFQGSSELNKLVEDKDWSYSSSSSQDITLHLAQSLCLQTLVKWNINWSAQDLFLGMEDN